MGHFFLAMNPTAFSESVSFDACLREYLADLRTQPANEGAEVLAPGDREWRCRARRDADGIPLDSANQAAYATLAAEFDVEPLTPLP
jgi:LDH2 family malate/lactate/ureidoglycolate dehydrogenase